MSGRLSRKRRAPPTPQACPASLDITDDFSDEAVIFRAPKKPRSDARNRCSKASSSESSLRKISSRNTSFKSTPAPEADVTDKENVSTEKNSLTKNTGKRKEVIVLTLDDDDDEEKQGDESDDSESPFPALHSPEKARSCLSSRVGSRKELDAAVQTQSKSSSSGSKSAATTSSYFSAPAAGPKLNLVNRRPSKFHRGGAQNASYTAPDRRRDETKNKLVRSCDPHKKQLASKLETCKTLSINADETEALHSASDTDCQHDVVGSEDEGVTAAGIEKLPTKTVKKQEKLASPANKKDRLDGVVSEREPIAAGNTENLTSKHVNTQEKMVGVSETEKEQVRASDNDDASSIASNADQGRLVATVSDDDEEEEYNLDSFPVDPFLAEMEKSVCSEHEKLCPSCKRIVPVSRYGSHLRLCFSKYQHSKQGDQGTSGSRRRGRSAAVNQIEKSAVERHSSTGNDQVDRVGTETLTSADVCDDFKEQENKSKGERTKGKSFRSNLTKSRHRLECEEQHQQQHKEPERGREASKDDLSHDVRTMELLQKGNRLGHQPDELKIRQEKLIGDGLPSSGGGGIVKNRQPLLSFAAGVLQVVQREESTACVLDPAAALTTEPSCMVRIKRSRGQTSSTSGAPAPDPGAPRGRRRRGKKGLLVTCVVSAEQRSVALAERLAAVLLSGKPDEDEPWESVTRGRRTAVGARLSGAVTRVISADQPLWQLCRSDRGDIQQYYVPELAPHLVPPIRGDSLNITMHRHLSQIPGRLNITQSLGLPGDVFTDDEEEPYGLEDRSTSVLYGNLNTTQLALVRLLGSQADQILNWSLRSTADTGGEGATLGTRGERDDADGCGMKSPEEGQDCGLQGTYAQEGPDIEGCEKKSMEKGPGRCGELNKRGGRDGEECDFVEERDILHRIDCSGKKLEDKGSACLTNRREDVGELSDRVAESGNDTKLKVEETQGPVAGNKHILCNDASSLVADKSSLKCADAKKRESAKTSAERSITDDVDVGHRPETVASLQQKNTTVDGETDLIKTIHITEKSCEDNQSHENVTRKVDGSRQGTCTRKNSQYDGKKIEDDETKAIFSVDASAVISEAVLRIAHMKHGSGDVECIKTTQMNIPACEAFDALQLPVATDALKSIEDEDTKPMMPSLLTKPAISSSTTCKEIHTTALANETASQGGSDCSIEGDAKAQSVSEDRVGEPDGSVWQDGDSTKSFRSRDDAASDVTILFDTSADAEVTTRQQKTNVFRPIDSRKTLEKRNDGKETPEKTSSKEVGAKEGSINDTIVFDMYDKFSNAGNPSNDNRRSSSTTLQIREEHTPRRVSPDVILVDDGSSTKSLSNKTSNTTIRESLIHGQQQSDCSPTAKDISSANRANSVSRAADLNAYETKADLNCGAGPRGDEKGEQPGLCESVPRHCTTIPASDSSVSDDGTDQMFSKTKTTNVRKRITCSKRTLSNLSVKNLSRFNSLQAASSSNPNPASQSSDYMLERYLSTLVRDASTPAPPTSPSVEGRVRERSSGVKLAVESLSIIQNTMLTTMAAAWTELLESGVGGDVTVYTREGNFLVHAFVLRVRCSTLMKEAHGKAQSESNAERISDGEESSKTPYLLWRNHSHEASRHFFSYIYGGSCDWKSDEPAVVREVLSLALRYEREDLVQYCQATSLYQPRQETGNSRVQTQEGDTENNSLAIGSCDELGKFSSFRHQTTPVKVTPVPADKLNDSRVHINYPRRSLTFSLSSPADHDVSLPSLNGCENNTLDVTEKSKIRPGLSPDQQTTRRSTSRGSHQAAACHSMTVDKLSKTPVPTPIDISKLLEGKLCGMSGSVPQTACTNMSLDKLSKHYKSSATVRSVSPDLFSDGDEDPVDQSMHSQERIRDNLHQSLISNDKLNLHHSDHSAHSKILPNISDHSARSNKGFPDSDVRLRLSSVDQTNSTVRDDTGNDNKKIKKYTVEQNEASNLCHSGLESNPKPPSKTDDQITSVNKNKLNISTSVVHGEDNIIDISQSDSETSRQSSTPTLTSVDQPPNVLLPLSPGKVDANQPCGELTDMGCSTTAELYNKTTDAESEAGQTSNAYVSNVWEDFEDMGCYQDDGGPLVSEPTIERPTCDKENQRQEEFSKDSEHLKPPTEVSDDRPKMSDAKSYGLNSTVLDAAKSKSLNLSSACQNISRISLGEAALQRRSECFGDTVTSREPALDAYTSARTGRSSINKLSDTGDLHSNSLVRKMFSNDTLLQLQDELQKEWDGEELELSTGINDTSLRSRLTNKRKREDEFCARESPKHKRKCRTPSKMKLNGTRNPSTSESIHPGPGTNHLIKNTNGIRNATKRQRDVCTSNTPSVDDQLPDVEGSPVMGALPHRVQQLQGRRDSITSLSTTSHSPNSSAADSSLAITPKPDFSTMPTPDLKRRLQQFGIRPLSRNKARALLQHIYEQTHPVVTAAQLCDAGGSDRLQSPVGGIRSGHSVAALRTSTPVGRSRAGTARRPTRKNKRAQAKTPLVTIDTAISVQSEAPRAKTRDQMLEASDCEERLRFHEAQVADISTINTAELVDLSQSDGEENSSAPGCAEESVLLQLPDEQPTAAAAADIESVHEQLRALIVSDSSLHRAVLLYQPLWLHHLKDAAANAGIRCTAAALVDFLDQQCITFRMGSSAGTGRTRTRQKKPRKKRVAVV